MHMTLAEAPLRRPLVIAAAPEDPAAAQRLMTLGWRPGAPTEVIRRTTGGARVIDLSGARIAVGGPLSKTLQVRPAEEAGR
ncbi:MAG: ferrous iron transport protein A [Propionibacteriaceae bacterium]|jgi:Fe2+ transport system protein FeoA|nr:ferrous iron transport protein A [Propionibacteriaceae bacterium]